MINDRNNISTDSALALYTKVEYEIFVITAGSQDDDPLNDLNKNFILEIDATLKAFEYQPTIHDSVNFHRAKLETVCKATFKLSQL